MLTAILLTALPALSPLTEPCLTGRFEGKPCQPNPCQSETCGIVFFHRRSTATSVPMSKQRMLNLPAEKLIADVVTPCNSSCV